MDVSHLCAAPNPAAPRIQDAPQNLSEIPNVSLPEGTCFFGCGEVSKMSFLFGRWFPWNIMKYQGCMLTLSGWRERICQSCVEISLVPNISQINDHNMQDLIGRTLRLRNQQKYLGSRKSCFHDLFDHNSDAVGDPESDRFVDTVALNNLTTWDVSKKQDSTDSTTWMNSTLKCTKNIPRSDGPEPSWRLLNWYTPNSTTE